MTISTPRKTYSFFVLCFFYFCLLFVCGCKYNNTHQVTHGYIEGRLTYISSQVSGTLKQLKVKKGSQVKLQQVLFYLDTKPQDIELTKAKAKVAQAKANLANLEKGKRPTELAAIRAKQRQITAKLTYSKETVTRYKKLYRQKVLDKSGLDEAVANYTNLQAQLSEINENLKTAQLTARVDEIAAAKASTAEALAVLQSTKWQLSQKTIKAPIAGEIYDIYYRAGEIVPINSAVLSILAPQNVYAIFYIPEDNLASTNLKQKVLITCDGTAHKFTAEISYISPKAEYAPPVIYSEKTRHKLVYRVEAEFNKNDAEKIHPGQPITVDFAEKTHA